MVVLVWFLPFEVCHHCGLSSGGLLQNASWSLRSFSRCASLPT